MQLCIENVDQSGGCGYGYSCVYTDTISWASPTKPLPMIRDPRVVFDQMFGVLGMRIARRGGANGGRKTSASSTGCANPSKRARAHARRRRSRPPHRLSRQRPRDRAPHPGGREAQRQRRAARAADGAARRSGFVRRSRQADVRPADAGVPIGHHARLLVQARPRRLESRLSRKAARPARSTSCRTTPKSRNACASWRRSTRITSACCRIS